MPDKYLINQADLVNVADALREKADKQGSLLFPAEFISTLQAIQTFADTASIRVLAVSSIEDIPASAPENTIVVVTDLAIGNASFVRSTPKTASTGDLYISTIGDYTINLAVTGSIMLSIGKVRIWRESNWYLADAYLYTSSMWQQLSNSVTYLFNRGDTYEDVTGGWTGYLPGSLKYLDLSTHDSDAAKGNTRSYLNASSSTIRALLEVSEVSSSGVQIKVSTAYDIQSEPITYATSESILVTSAGEYIVTLTSNINGKFVVVEALNKKSGKGADIRLLEVWFE